MAVAGPLGAGGSAAGAGGEAGPAGPGVPVVAGGGAEPDLEMMAVWLATVVVVVVEPVVEVVVEAAVVCGRVAGGPEASAWAGMGTVSSPAKVRSDTTPAAVTRICWRVSGPRPCCAFVTSSGSRVAGGSTRAKVARFGGNDRVQQRVRLGQGQVVTGTGQEVERAVR